MAGRGSESPGRTVATTVTATLLRRRKRTQSGRAGPARCASSISTTSGPRSARRPGTRSSAAYSTAGPSMLSASIGGLVLFAVYHHAHQRSSAYREHWR